MNEKEVKEMSTRQDRNECYLTFNLENYAEKSFNYLEKMVDRYGLPYFNVFWTDPAEAAHDWPDFGDVMARQFQAAIMARNMTGKEVSTEKVWYNKLLSYVDPETGLLFRPKTSYSQPIADIGDQALTLYAFVTAYLDNKERDLRMRIFKMIDTLLEKTRNGEITSEFILGFILKPLMVCVRYMGYEPAFEMAKIIVQKIFAEDSPVFTPNNTFRHGGHMHINLRTLVGAADYALYAKDPIIYSRIDAIYCYVKSEATRFGFLPEVIGRKGDIVSCETCAIMDYLGLAVTLANHGHPEYWSDIERVTRNHLIESQVKDTSWLNSDSTREDTEQFTWRNIGERMIGGWAGWSSPNHILAAKETLNWGGPELRGKPRAFQNCCGGSGIHALFTVWKNASYLKGGCLYVNLHIDKLLPQAEIRSYQPYKGLLIINLKESCDIKVRIPDFVDPKELKVEGDKGDIDYTVWGNYINIMRRQGGDTIKITYPLPIFEEEFSIGNPGYRRYYYRATWKGDTVIKIEPLGNEYETGYSDFDKKEVSIFYGTKGPATLYCRDYMLENIGPKLSQIHLDDGQLNFWLIG